jgi:hypothetical protein
MIAIMNVKNNGWKKNSSRNPYTKQTVPIEVMLHDGQVVILERPNETNDAVHPDEVANWRTVPAGIWAERGTRI